MFKSKKAFTLIELLVVIAIIGILVTIAVIALNSARSKARDAKRVANIKQVQTALELFFNDKNRYPTLSEYNSGALYSTSSFNGTTTYMEIVPEAPTPPDGNCTNNQNQFSYTPTNNGGSYTISYCLGNPTGSIAEGPHCATPSTIAGGACDGSGVVCDDNVEFCGFTTCGTNGTYGGQQYPTVQIGSQCWFKENLNYGTYIGSSASTFGLDGDSGTIDDCIQIVTDTWSCQGADGVQKYCYNNDQSAGCSNGWGGLYEWAEAMKFPYQCNNANFPSGSSDCGLGGTVYVILSKHQGVCPAGWHIPTMTEITALNIFLGSDSGDKLKSATSTWNDDANNSSGFSALPAGYREWDGSGFSFRNYYTNLLSSSPEPTKPDLVGVLSINTGNSFVNYDADNRVRGFPVRCLKD